MQRLWFIVDRLRQGILGYRQERAFRRSNGIVLEGTVILYGAPDDISPMIRQRLGAALTLMADDRRASRRFQSYVRRIYIRPGRVSGFLPATRTIVLALELLQTGGIEEIASVLVHETIHARFNASGVGTWSTRIARIESCCLRHQMSFLERFPGTDDVLKHLKEYTHKPWWNNL